MNFRSSLIAAAAVVITAAAATSAQAAVFIGVRIGTAGAITQIATDPISASVEDFLLGNFTVDIDGSVVPFPDILDSNTLDVTSSGGNQTIDIFVTRNLVGSPNAGQSFRSAFTAVSVSSGFNVRTRTYVDVNNGLFTETMGNLVGDRNFTSGGFQEAFGSGLVDGQYSVTQRYTVTAGAGSGRVNAAITMAAVPEPATWAMMISGFGAAGAMLRRRRALSVPA